MKHFLLLIFFCLLFSPVLHAQDDETHYYLSAWKVADTSQSRRYVETSNRFSRQPDSVKTRILKNIYDWLHAHPNPRVTVRAMLLEQPWWLMCTSDKPILEAVLPLFPFQLNRPEASFVPLRWAIQQARKLGDDQLLSDVYVAYAEHCTRIADHQDFLLYATMALEMQQKIGAVHFPDIDIESKLFDVCKALFICREYPQSIEYGKKVLEKSPHHVFTHDLVGGAYKKMGKYDSSMLYYNKLLEVLEQDSAQMDRGFYQKWRVIARGNQGMLLALQQRFDEALPILKEYAEQSAKLVDGFNVSLANAALAKIYFLQQNYPATLQCWKQVYQWSFTPGNYNYEYAALSAEGIAATYYALGKSDSAFYYSGLSHQYNDTVHAFIARSNIQATQARMAFGRVNTDLEQASVRAGRERMVRNFILAGIVLVSIISLLLYNRKVWRHRYQTAVIERKRQAAEAETLRAKEQIHQFTHQIIEKNNLIEQLNEKLSQQALSPSIDGEPAATTPDSLLQYTFVTEEQWEEFRREFSKAYPAFFPRLKQRVPSPTPAEERLAALIYLDLNSFQIANTLGISKDSVARSKRRLKQRLNLEEEILEDYLKTLNA